MIDSRLSEALTVQLQDWRSALGSGARRVGWKIGAGDAERIGPGPALGHLTSATQLEVGARYHAAVDAALHADVEVAVLMGRDLDPGADREQVRGAIGGFGTALELVDLSGLSDDPETIVADNIFHRAFTVSDLDHPAPRRAAQGRLIVGGTARASAAVSDAVGATCAAAAVLGAIGERLRAGDCLITGAVVQVPVAPGDHVAAEIDGLDRVELAIAA